VLKLRILTVAALLPVFVAGAFWLPNAWWAAALFVITMLGAGEWSRLAGFGRFISAVFHGLLALGCAAVWLDGDLDMWIYAASILFWIVVAPLALWRKSILRSHVALGAAGLVVLLPMWLALVRLQFHPGLMLAMLAVVWVSDTAAYGAGRALGRHKLAPLISPGKTWEGVGGAFAAVAVYAAIFHFWWFPAMDPWFVLIAFIAMTILGILGDLVESLLKRNAAVKDSGTLLPGHGGILDRVDALTAAMPLAALLFAR
jgi:phosphatidate cytidylyltransferase